MNEEIFCQINRMYILNRPVEIQTFPSLHIDFLFKSEPVLNLKHYSKMSFLNLEQMYISELDIRGP